MRSEHEAESEDRRGLPRAARGAGRGREPALDGRRAGAGQVDGARASKSIPRFRSRCRTAGIRARRSACGWMRRITSGSFIVPTCSTPSKPPATRRPASAARSAPPVLEFDQQGKLLRHWGGQDGPGYQWPASNHGLNIDNKGNVWIGGNGAPDGHILEFTQDGKFVKQVGKKGVTRDSLATDHFFQVAKTFFYAPANEVFVADGYGNKRVAVIDADSGKMKRFWGAYGNSRTMRRRSRRAPTIRRSPISSSAGRCTAPTCRSTSWSTSATARATAAGLSSPTAPSCARSTSSATRAATAPRWDVAFSRDPQQKYLYVADGRNQKVHIFDRATHDRADDVRQGRALSRASGIRCTTSRPTRRATSTRRRPTRAAGCSGSSTRAWRRCTRGSRASRGRAPHRRRVDRDTRQIAT